MEALKNLLIKIVSSDKEEIQLIIPNRDKLTSLISNLENICRVSDEVETFAIYPANDPYRKITLGGIELKYAIKYPLIVKLSTEYAYPNNSNWERNKGILRLSEKWSVDGKINGSSIEYLKRHYGVKLTIKSLEMSVDEFLGVYADGEDCEVVKYKESLR